MPVYQATGFGTSPPPKDSLEVWGVEAFLCAQTLPLTYRHKMKKQCSKYSLKMENTKIFQKDGKDEYILNG